MITVVLPVYNGGALLRRCLDSLAAQDCAPGAFDLVVLDSGSTDGGLDALRLLPSHIQRRVVGSDRPLSIEQNWARIRDLGGTRDFITILGHDDVFDPGFIRVVTRALTERSDIRFLLTHFRLIDENNRILRACRPMAALESAASFLAGRLAGIRDSFGTGYVMRFSDYRDAGGIPAYPKLIYADDALWLTLAQIHGLHILPDECFSYCLRGSNTSYVTDANVFLEGFSSYLDVLERMAAEDADVRDVLVRYGPAFTEELASRWALEESNRANRLNEDARPHVIEGWLTVRRRMAALTGSQAAAWPPPSPELEFSLWANRNPLSRRLWGHRPVRAFMRSARRSLIALPFRRR